MTNLKKMTITGNLNNDLFRDVSKTTFYNNEFKIVISFAPETYTQGQLLIEVFNHKENNSKKINEHQLKVGFHMSGGYAYLDAYENLRISIDIYGDSNENTQLFELEKLYPRLTTQSLVLLLKMVMVYNRHDFSTKVCDLLMLYIRLYDLAILFGANNGNEFSTIYLHEIFYVEMHEGIFAHTVFMSERELHGLFIYPKDSKFFYDSRMANNSVPLNNRIHYVEKELTGIKEFVLSMHEEVDHTLNPSLIPLTDKAIIHYIA